MALLNLALFLGLQLIVAVMAGMVRYDGHQVLRAYPSNLEQAKTLLSMREKYDFWSEPSLGGTTDIRISAEEKDFLTDLFRQAGIQYEVLISDLQERIRKDRDGLKVTETMDWETYHGFETIYSWMEALAAQNSDVAQVYDIGTSTEGRPLRIIKIGYESATGNLKKGLWIDSGMHAREWIGPAVATYVMNELVINAQTYRELLQQVDFYILPLANVDGYEYSRKSDRLWRKTRSDYNDPRHCKGVDPNRNFGYFWGGEGTSEDKCSDIYRGPAPFSEPEVDAMRNFITKANGTSVDWKTYIALHSYAQMILAPWGYDVVYPEDYAELKLLGDKAAKALSACFGTSYEVGGAAEILYPAAGASDDWSKGSGFFKFAYTYEMRDQGANGFLLPPQQILPTSIETWKAIEVMARYLIR